MKNVLLGLGFLIAVVVFGLGIYGGLNQEKNNKKEDNSNLLSCNVSEYVSAYKANSTVTVNMKFDEDNFIDNINATMIFKFDDQSNYDSWKQLYNSNNQMDFSGMGMDSRNEFNDENKTLKVLIDQKYSEIPQENMNKNFPTNFNDLKKHYLDLGYNCNGETKSSDSNSQNNNFNTKIGKVYSITEKINVRNNLFEYKNFKYDENSEFGSAFISDGNLTNISNEDQKFNIHIKLYDADKNLIGDYQYEKNKEIDKSDQYWEMFVLAPNETKKPSFTFYDDDLFPNKTLKEVKYYSIENIDF